MQQCVTFRIRKNAKRREPTNTGREPGLSGTGSGRFNPLSHPLLRALESPFLFSFLTSSTQARTNLMDNMLTSKTKQV